ncbi:MAG TPA: hypothetical protein VHV29_10000 [Terriglobales bacterium]|jgi:F0F1-type ATP synthase delta subunit|nr:hypothetical protein [Terriglobales bacterium]
MSKPHTSRNDAATLSLLVLLTGKTRRQIISEAISEYFDARAVAKDESELQKVVTQPELTVAELEALSDQVIARETFRNFDPSKATRQ